MTLTVVSKSFVALPWYGAIVLVIEVTGVSGATLDLTTLDGGQGLKFVDGVIGFNASGVIVNTNGPTVSSNGTTVTQGTDTTVVTIVVIGR